MKDELTRFASLLMSLTAKSVYWACGRFGAPTELPRSPRVLVVRVDGIGDLVLTTPIFRNIKAAYPEAEITVAASEEAADILEGLSSVDHLIKCKLVTSGRFKRIRKIVGALEISRKHLWPKKFDLAISPRWNFGNGDLFAAMLILCSGATRRIGYSDTSATIRGDIPRGFDHFFTNVVVREVPEHEAKNALDITGSTFGNSSNWELDIAVSEKERVRIDEVLTEYGIGKNDKLIAVLPGCGGSQRKQWPVKRFAEAGRELRKRLKTRVIIIGGSSDKKLCHQVEVLGEGKFVNLAGQFKLRETAALLKRCLLLLTNDAGPMHIATAMHCPVVIMVCHPLDGAPLHRASPLRFGPWQGLSRVLQPETGLNGCSISCQHDEPHCILAIDVSSCIDAALSLVQR